MGMIVMQFVGNDSWGSRLIKWFDHGDYSHVDTVMPDGSLLGARNNVISGIPAGVQIRPASYVEGYISKRVSIPCADSQADVYYDFVQTQIGKPYDQLAIVAFAIGRNWRNDSAWFCSELNSSALEKSGVVNRLIAPANKIAPNGLLLVLSALVQINE